MNNIIRLWNQNRKGIIVGVVAIVLLIVIIQILNQMVKEQNKPTNLIENRQTQEELPTQSIIGKGSVSEETTKSNVEIIETFIEECNNGNVTKAYNMLTEGCKQTLFPKEENFKKGYYDIIFTTKRISNIENFRNDNKIYVYRVTLYNDVLSTGNMENAQSYQDYITIDENNEKGKISINSLIKRKEINSENEKDGIKITIISQMIYKDHEDYEIKIENKTNKRILIDTREKSKSIYLIGSNNVTYNSNIYEIASILYEIPEYFNRTYTLKFKKTYNATNAKSISFSDIVLDCEKYKQEPEEVKERLKINISI